MKGRSVGYPNIFRTQVPVRNGSGAKVAVVSRIEQGMMVD
jgi:hypothetical protein